MYGQQQHFVAAENTTACPQLVPRIIHLAWYGPSRPVFRFHHLISLVSSLRFVHPEEIMFWHDHPPKGKWWRLALRKINKSKTTLRMMQRDAPESIFGTRVIYSEHQSDIVRLEAIMQYGGIYHDLDVIILRSLDPLFCYETTMGEELPHWLCNGFIMSVANATFLRLWYDSYHTFKASHWNMHSVVMPGRIASHHPELIHVENDSIHKPNWGAVGLRQLYDPGFSYDWRSRNYAVHLCYRKYNIDHTPQSIKHLNTTMGDIFRYIFYGTSDMG